MGKLKEKANEGDFDVRSERRKARVWNVWICSGTIFADRFRFLY
jgi:hypothetical protein